MADPTPAPRGRKRGIPALGTTLIDDFLRGDLPKTFRRDINELYDFYLDEERRRRLGGMGRAKRWLTLLWWLLEGLILKLPPLRRLMLLLCLLMFFWGAFSLSSGKLDVSIHASAGSFVLLLLILMMELKDKLLARDELEVGRAVQLALMPNRNPEIPGWEIWLYTRPANDVGGDLVDYLPLDTGHMGLILGDVAGKGLGAALLMAKLQSTLRALAGDFGSLAQLGGRINEILCRDGLPGRFATLSYLELKPESGAVRLLNAGHMPPTILSNGSQERPQSLNLPLGAFPEASFREQALEIPPGALVLIYSDGLTEARDAGGEFFEDMAFPQVLKRLPGLSAEGAGHLLIGEVDRFAGENKLEDDLSLIVLRRPG